MCQRYGVDCLVKNMQNVSYTIFEQQYFENLPAIAMESKSFFHKRIAVDLDGTIFHDAGDIDATFNNRTDLVPMEDAARYTQELMRDGYEILIYTCRPDYHRRYLEDQLKRNDIWYHYILFYTKPRVDIYLDNKGMHFTGWKKAYADIQLRHREALGLQQPFTTYEKQLQKIKIRYLPKITDLILDSGCGDGSVFQGTDYRCHGFDINPAAIELCRQVKNYELCTSDAGELLPMDKYEVVTLLGVLEHADHPEAVLNQHRGANQLYITVPNAGSFHRLIGKKAGIISSIIQLSEQDRKIGHKHYFSFPMFEVLMEQFATKHHFEIKQLGTAGFKIGSNAQMEGFSEIALHLHTAAIEAGLAGPNLSYGAEIFCHLVKR